VKSQIIEVLIYLNFLHTHVSFSVSDLKSLSVFFPLKYLTSVLLIIIIIVTNFNLTINVASVL